MMDRDEAERLLGVSRRAEWAFPTSSSGSVLFEPGATWVEPLLAEREAMAEAARFLVANDEPDAAMELAANAWRLWLLAGDVAGGREVLASILDVDPAPRSRWRAFAMYGDGLLAFRQGKREESRRRNEAALAASDDPEARVLGLLGLSRVALMEGDPERGRLLAGEARELARGMRPAMSQAPLHMLAQSTRMAGDLDTAAVLFEESLALNRRIGDPGMVVVELHNLGHVEAHRGNVDAAELHFAEAASSASPDDPYDAAMTNLGRGVVAFVRGDRDLAASLLAGARETFSAAGIDPAPDDAAELDRLERALAEGGA